AITNSDAYQPDIEKFVDNVTLPAIAARKAPAAEPVASNSGDVAKLIGRWQRSSSSSPSYADSASWGTAGYTKCRYDFNADGTYIYTERSFRYSYQNIIIVRESGRYSLNGNTLTVTPAKSTISAYAKAGGTDALGPVVSTQNRKLETVAYRLTFHYFSGIQEWNLVLQADSPTQRDGQFSTLKVFENAWYFDQKFTSGDLTAVRSN
ncbi:MAG: lipocalin family protein, partial [bacterium]|nr:lipocalin family protein [bacterium]